MNLDPSREQNSDSRYFVGIEQDVAGNWMWAQGCPDNDVAVTMQFFSFQEQNEHSFEEIAELLGTSSAELEVILGRTEAAVREAIAATKTHKKKEKTEPLAEASWGSRVIDLSAESERHPSLIGKIGGEIIHNCADISGSDRAMFSSKLVKDQQRIIRKLCNHCELKISCGDMAVEEHRSNKVYGAMTRLGLSTAIRENERLNKPKKKKKKL